MAASDWTMQFLADMIAAPVDRPVGTETTALGAAYLAGLAAGICPAPADFARSWALQRRFEPDMGEEDRAGLYAGWQDAVRRTRSVYVQSPASSRFGAWLPRICRATAMARR